MGVCGLWEPIRYGFPSALLPSDILLLSVLLYFIATNLLQQQLYRPYILFLLHRVFSNNIPSREIAFKSLRKIRFHKYNLWNRTSSDNNATYSSIIIR